MSKRNVPDKYKRAYSQAIAGNSRSKSIKVFCLECCGWNRSEREKCSDTGCVLHKFRNSAAVKNAE